MTETSIQKHLDTYILHRDNGDIIEETIQPDKIVLTLKDKSEVTLPKHVEIHRFVVIGRRNH